MPAKIRDRGKHVREKGVSSIVVIAVVIVIIAAVGVGSYSLLKGGGAGLSSLSVYTGSQSWAIPSEYQENLPAGGGVEVAGYTVSGASVQAVLDWYRGQMIGWTLESEPVMSMGGVEIGGLIYMKGDDGAGIIAMSGMGLPGTCYILATGPWSAFGELEGQGTPPSAMLMVMARASGNVVTLTISHEGGDDLALSDLKVMASDSTGTMITVTLSPSSGTLSVGGVAYATYTYGPSPTGKAITVYITHVPTGQKIFSSSGIVVQPSAGAPPSAMLTVTAKDNSTGGYDLTISHEGGDDLVASDLEIQASSSATTMTTGLTFTTTSGTFTVGSSVKIHCPYPSGSSTGRAVTVYIIHKPSQQKLFSSSGVVVTSA